MTLAELGDLAALERHPDTDPAQAAERAAARIARQAVLERDRPPRVWVLIDESVLYREVAAPKTPEVTVAYLDHQADAMTTDSPATVALLCSRFDSLRTEAFRGSESLILIEEAAERWASS